MSTSKKIKKAGIYIVSLLGAAGTALQNYMAVIALFQAIAQGTATLSKSIWALLHGIAISFGGVCTGVVNLCINVELIESFIDRFVQNNFPKDLKGARKFRFWFGCAVFIVTGILFGLTALAFGPIGTLAAIGIAAGLFVSVIMVMQELETWFRSFKTNKPLKDIFTDWKKSLTKGKIVGIAIAVGNVVALSLLFTLGLASLLTYVGVAALPAFIIGLSVAFTGGAFTEFYFYNEFLSDFCDKIKERWKEFKTTPYPVLGAAISIINASINGILAYTGIMMITGLLTAASIAVPPIGVMIAIAATAAVFAGTASLILGVDFWISRFKKKEEPAASPAIKRSLSTTALLMDEHGLDSSNSCDNTVINDHAPAFSDVNHPVDAIPVSSLDDLPRGKFGFAAL